MTTTIAAFSAEDVCRLTGLTIRQLQYWDKTGFFHPHYADEDRQPSYSRVYDFRDVVGLRTIVLLRNIYNVLLQHLWTIGAWLVEHYETPWASLRFFAGGGKAFFDEPDTRARMASHQPGQTSFTFEMIAVKREMSQAAERLKERTPDQIGKTERNRRVLHNALVIAGTRIPTSAIWAYHEDGYSTGEIIQAYPRLTPRDIEVAIAQESARHQQHVG